MVKNHIFSKGEKVQVLDENHELHGKVAEVLHFYQGTSVYLLKFSCGATAPVHMKKVVKWLDISQHKELYLHQMIQLQLLALELEDRDWFEEIGKRLTKIEEYSTND